MSLGTYWHKGEYLGGADAGEDEHNELCDTQRINNILLIKRINVL